MIRTRENASADVTYHGDAELQHPVDSRASVSWPVRPGPGAHPETYCPFTEIIVDEDRGWKGLNPCYHDRTVTKLGPEFGPYPCSAWKLIDNVWVEGVRWNVANVSSQYNWNPLVSLVGNPSTQHVASDPDSWVIPDYTAEAWSKIKPQIKDELSLLNSLYELKDFKRLPQLIKQTQGTLNRFRSLVEVTKGKTLRQIVSTGTGHYLNYMFAVSPLVRDLTALQKAFTTARNGLKSMYARANKVHTSHFSKDLDAASCGFNEVSEDEAVAIRPQESCKAKTVKSLVSCRYTVTVRYKFTIPDEIGRIAGLLAKLDSLGINLNPAIIWNAVPFSFVVDWFLSVGQSLDKLKIAALPVNVSIYGSCHSIRYLATHEVFVYPYEYMNTPVVLANNPTWVFRRALSRVRVASKQRTVYIRRPTPIAMFETPKWSDFSTTEKWLSGALIGSIYTGRR